jgi:hypothetical protein
MRELRLKNFFVNRKTMLDTRCEYLNQCLRVRRDQFRVVKLGSFRLRNRRK